MVDYTQQKLRSIIYGEQKDLDEFDVDNENSLDSTMLDMLESSQIIKWEGAHRYIPDIFNQVYYITTLVLMEKRPLHFLEKYIRIARHTSSYYDEDLSRETAFSDYSEPVIMAMVYNYLRAIIDKSTNKNISRLVVRIANEYFTSSIIEDRYKLFRQFILDIKDLKKLEVDESRFKPLCIPTEEEAESAPASQIAETEQKYNKIANKYVELEKELEELKAKQQGSSDGDEISKLQQENLDLKEQVKAYEEQQQEETNLAQIDFQNKVRLDLLLRLMKKDGADLEKHGNKRRAATIMNIVTGIPIPTCKNYCSEPILRENSHKREIADINPVLQKLGMQTTL